MPSSRLVSVLSLTAAVVCGWFVSLPAQQEPQVSPSLFAEMRWRNIGPFRAGRTKAAAGHPSQPFTFYIGMVNGGVWKTTDAGRTWKPIFDDQPTGSIGWVVVAPSDPNIVYVGSGEGLPRPDLAVGDGIYKSTDAGRTWTHLGLRDAQQIPKIAVDPQESESPLRRRARPSVRAQRGARHLPLHRRRQDVRERPLQGREHRRQGRRHRSLEPRRSSTRRCGKQRQGPWENAAWDGTNGGIFKSTDGGTTWTPADAGPARRRRQRGARRSPPATRGVSTRPSKRGGDGTGIYRSDDAGETWTRSDDRSPARPAASTKSCRTSIPKDPDTLIVTDIVSYKSTDGGKTFVPFKGAPGGDDNQNIWWNPDNPDIMLLVVDQGAVVTLNGGQTWSSWYTQPTAALYHVMTDNAFPYRVCGGQQDSGSVCVASRGNDGQITFRDWHPVGVEEYGYAAPDPLRSRPRLRRQGHALRPPHRAGVERRTRCRRTRWRRCRQARRIGPFARSRSCSRTVDPHVLFYGNNVLWKTIDGGINWKQISPDLTRETWDVPKSVGTYTSRVQSPDARRRSARRSSTRSARPTATSTASGSAPTTA